MIEIFNHVQALLAKVLNRSAIGSDAPISGDIRITSVRNSLGCSTLSESYIHDD